MTLLSLHCFNDFLDRFQQLNEWKKRPNLSRIIFCYQQKASAYLSCWWLHLQSSGKRPRMNPAQWLCSWIKDKKLIIKTGENFSVLLILARWKTDKNSFKNFQQNFSLDINYYFLKYWSKSALYETKKSPKHWGIS